MRLILTTIVCLFLTACVTDQSTSSYNDNLKTLTVTSDECGGRRLKLPDVSFNPAGRSRARTLAYYECFRHNAPEDKQGLIAGQAVMWQGVFDKTMTPAEARTLWQKTLQQDALNNEDLFTKYLRYRAANPRDNSILQQGMAGGQPMNDMGSGIPVYGSGACIGANVMGECHGAVMGQPIAHCHGTMINGQCTGPMF